MPKPKSTIVEQLKAVLGYLRSLAGFASAAPGLVAVLDSWASFLGISSAIKPLVYVVAVVAIAYVFFSEVARYIRTSSSSPEFSRMPDRARLHFVSAAILAAVYWVGVSYLETHLPAQEWLQRAALVGSMIVVVSAFAELTRAFAILGLRIYIAKNMP